MHHVDILDEVRERVTRRRGGVAVFNSLRPRQTAHIVVDLQNGQNGDAYLPDIPLPMPNTPCQ